jgi:hypothetical protein
MRAYEEWTVKHLKAVIGWDGAIAPRWPQ